MLRALFAVAVAVAVVPARVPPPIVIWTAPWPRSTPIGGAGRIPAPTSARVRPVPGITTLLDADAVCWTEAVADALVDSVALPDVPVLPRAVSDAAQLPLALAPAAPVALPEAVVALPVVAADSVVLDVLLGALLNVPEDLLLKLPDAPLLIVPAALVLSVPEALLPRLADPVEAAAPLLLDEPPLLLDKTEAVPTDWVTLPDEALLALVTRALPFWLEVATFVPEPVVPVAPEPFAVQAARPSVAASARLSRAVGFRSGSDNNGFSLPF